MENGLHRTDSNGFFLEFFFILPVHRDKQRIRESVNHQRMAAQ